MGLTNSVTDWKMKKVTGTTAQLVLGAGDVFGGLFMSVAGTTTTVACYDALSALAIQLFIPTTATLTAGQYVSPTGSVVPITASRDLSAGVILSTGLWMVIGGSASPTFWVLYK